MFSRAEALEEEEQSLQRIARELAGIRRTDPPDRLHEARRLIARLHDLNRRWNIAGLDRFLIQRQKDLFY